MFSLINHPTGDDVLSQLTKSETKQIVQTFKVPAREHSVQKNKAVFFFSVDRLSCIDIRILQVTVALLDHLQIEQISYRELGFVFCLAMAVIKLSLLGWITTWLPAIKPR